MGREIGESLWEIHGQEPGPTVLVLGGTHGNEQTGILVVQDLLAGFQSGTYQLSSGTLLLGIGNPEAVAAGVRGIAGRDLNRYFTPEHLEQPIEGTETQKRARVLAGVCDRADILIDIHSTNKPSKPFICSMIDEVHERVYRWFGAETVLWDPKYVLAGHPATIDEYMNRQGKVGMCIETGEAADTSRVPDTIASVFALLTDLGLCAGTPARIPTSSHKQYVLHRCIRRDERPFTFAAGRGERSFEPIAAGDCIGYLGDEAVCADVSGVLVFPKLPEHQGEGLPVVYVATEKP